MYILIIIEVDMESDHFLLIYHHCFIYLFYRLPQIPVILLHLVGGLLGYFLPKVLGFGEVACRTMAIETAMKSSAFGFLLAKLHFGQYAARVPSAVSVVWMALTGSILAVIWRYIPVKPAFEGFDRSLAKKYPPFKPKEFLSKLFS